MKRLITCFFVLGMALVLMPFGNAATLNLTPGGSIGSPLTGVIPGGIAPNDFLGPGNLFSSMTGIAGYFGSTINYSVIGAGSITYEFFGGEAGFHDQLFYNSGSGFALLPGFDHAGNPGPSREVATTFVPKATFTTALSGAGILPFEFMINGVVGGLTGGPINGAGPLNTSGLPPNFFVACGPLVSSGPTALTCDSMWVFLDDNGASNDDDFDDFVVRITATNGPVTVPESGSFALIGTALLGLGLLRRRL